MRLRVRLDLYGTPCTTSNVKESIVYETKVTFASGCNFAEGHKNVKHFTFLGRSLCIIF